MSPESRAVRPNSLEARDVASHLHPMTDLKRHETVGPLVITEGRGVRVWDAEGREYIEGMAGLWCAALGFGVERLAEAAARQIRRLSFYHGFNHKSHDQVIRLAERLLALSPVPMGRVFFANSGSEAVDSAIKLVRYYNNALGRPHKKKLIARERAYHGVTVAGGSLTGLSPMQQGFDLPMSGVLRTGCPHAYRHARPGESEEDFATRLAEELDALIRAEGPETVAAFFAEPVMGAGGVIVPPCTYFEKVQKVLKAHDVLLVADEVICGFGRTGRLFGCQTFDIRPDMITLAKALSNGAVPISALLVSTPIYEAARDYSGERGLFGHGFTYSGHPVAAAVALETLDLFEEWRVMDHVAVTAPLVQEGLRRLADHPLVGEARGIGMVGALELVADKQERRPFDASLGVGPKLVAHAQERGLILRAMGDVVALSPPLVIGEQDLGLVFERLHAALDDTRSWLRRQDAAR